MVIAVGGRGRNTRICSRGDAARVDGERAHGAGSRREAGWTIDHVHDSPGVIQLRHAWNIFVGYSLKRRAVPRTRHPEWHRILSGGASLLFNRSNFRHAFMVDLGRYVFMCGFWRCPTMAESHKIGCEKATMKKEYSFKIDMIKP